ncbi:DNA repair protein RadC [Candidatus Latescibacterota bacterium]
MNRDGAASAGWLTTQRSPSPVGRAGCRLGDGLPATGPKSRRNGPARDGSGADLPRERLQRCGVAALRDHELLAVVLGTGYRGRGVLEVARAVLEQYPKEELVHLGPDELEGLKGLGAAKAGILVAAFELARRGLHKGLGVLPAIDSPAETVPLLADIKDQPKEYFLSLYLNARNQVIHREVISIGSLSASIVHPREVFLAAVQHSAARLILAHNHPSGDITPSCEDLDLTRRLVEAGQLMGIEVLDHIIIAAADYLSLKEKGLM